MIQRIFKSLLFVVLISPLASLGMEPFDHAQDRVQPDKIELGKQLVEAAKSSNWDKVERLIGQYADVNQVGFDGSSALMWAVMDDQLKIVKMLIETKADLNLQTSHGTTALMFAVSNNRDLIVPLLIDAHADLNLRNVEEGTALRMAARWSDISISHMIIDAMIKQKEEQKERIYTFLTCLKQIPGFKNTNLPRDLFKPILLPTLTDVRQEINRIRIEDVRTQLLEKYGFQPITDAETQ